jgi:tricorn protease
MMDERGYYRYATIFGETIVFACEDDLWTVSTKGGAANRITTNRGECSLPRFSPDGKRLAFVGRTEGHPEVYIMPAAGGMPKRLSYLGAESCVVCGWSKNGKEIYFVSDAQSPFLRHAQAFSVAADGGIPRQLELGHMQYFDVSIKGKFLIGRNSLDPARWKRYRGGTAGDIWIETEGKKFKPLLNLTGNHVAPMWVGERVYFLSDHEGIGNLYSCKSDGTDITRLTDHDDYYVRYPSSDGKQIVYTAGGEIYLYDIGKKKSRQIEIKTPPTGFQTQRKFVECGHYLEHYALHPEGHSLAVISRGQPITLGNWEGAVMHHGSGSAGRTRHSEWMPDGKRIVLVNDREGYDRLEVHTVDQSQPPVLAPKLDLGRVLDLSVSPKADLVAVTNHKQQLLTVDLKSFAVRVLDCSPASRIHSLDWSPDGRWLAYVFAPHPLASIIKVVDTQTGVARAVTSELKIDYSPAFDPEGRYLYFLSTRDFFPIYDSTHFDLSFPASARPYVIPLRKDVPSPFIRKPKPLVAPAQQPAPENNGSKKEKEVGATEQKMKAEKAQGHSVPAAKGRENAAACRVGRESVAKSNRSQAIAQVRHQGEAADKPADKAGDKKNDAPSASPEAPNPGDPPKSPETIEIDFDGIEQRILAFPTDEGRYGAIAALKNRVVFSRYHIRGIRPNFNFLEERFDAGWLVMYDFEEQRAVNFVRELTTFRLAADHKTLAYRLGKHNLRVINASAPMPNDDAPAAGWDFSRKGGWINLNRAKILVQPIAEWKQMYEEAWRLQSEHFWDPRMSDVDWQLVHDRYERLLPRIRTRSELSDIIWEMQGELGTSHAYEFGGDYNHPPFYYRGFLGADTKWDETAGAYKILKIIRGDSWNQDVDSPLALPGVDVLENEYIHSVDGQEVTKELSIDELLINKYWQEVDLAVSKDGSQRRHVTVRTLGSERMLRYRNWVETNRRYVRDKTDGRIGYVHIPDMGPFGYAEFHRGYLSEYDRDGLIIDVRYNRGGHVSGLLLEKLARKRVGYNCSRWGQPSPYPYESAKGAMVTVTNQFAGSDGDTFSHCFKLYKLGPLVGKRTWGGVIGINPSHRLVDGSLTTQPEYSFWFIDVGFKVENYGTDPDYEVDIAPHDYRQGSDPQLDKAISLILDILQKNPPKVPEFSNKPSLPIPRVKKRK